ncbi:4Fe-4S binding protein, partial [Candidatus Bathyarchaeota archaeon]|nr:4Fe-4S binding protein [Candidatus Bathyarchaeota archaeon]
MEGKILSQLNVEEQKVLLYNPSRCTGCLFCEIACSY